MKRVPSGYRQHCTLKSQFLIKKYISSGSIDCLKRARFFGISCIFLFFTQMLVFLETFKQLLGFDVSLKNMPT